MKVSNWYQVPRLMSRKFSLAFKMTVIAAAVSVVASANAQVTMPSFPSGCSDSSAPSTNQSPAATVWNGTMYLAYMNTANNTIYVSPSANGTSFSNPGNFVASVSSAYGPAITSFNNQLWVAWVQGGQVYYSVSNDGFTWTPAAEWNAPPVEQGGLAAYAPALVVFNNALYVVATANAYFSTPQNVILSQFGGGVWIPTDLNFTYAVQSGPSAVVYNGQLWVAYTTGNQYVVLANASTFANGAGFSLYLDTAFTAGGTPQLVTWNSALYFGARSKFSADNLWMTGSLGDNNWSTPQQYGQTLTQSPGFAVLGTTLFEYEKSNFASNIWYCH